MYSERLLTDKQVAHKLSVVRSHVWRLVNSNRGFPPPIHVGVAAREQKSGHGTRWIESDIDAWLYAQRANPANMKTSEEYDDDPK